MEILIWGDNMKRQISISIFFAIFLILLVWLYIKFYNENKVNENELSTEVKIVKEEDAITISEDYHLYEFYIKDENGKVVVYQTKNQEFYMETGRDITKPKIEITNENYRYLQFIDILENRDNINIEVENANEILYKIIQECNLDFEKIIKDTLN